MPGDDLRERWVYLENRDEKPVDYNIVYFPLRHDTGVVPNIRCGLFCPIIVVECGKRPL